MLTDTLDVITVEDIAESADSKLFKSITQSNHCLHFLLRLLRIRYTLSAVEVIHISVPPGYRSGSPTAVQA